MIQNLQLIYNPYISSMRF